MPPPFGATDERITMTEHWLKVSERGREPGVTGSFSEIQMADLHGHDAEMQKRCRPLSHADPVPATAAQ